MEQRRRDVVAAARDVFLRYGHARTTMNDLAEAAGLSRPALYLVFPSKDQVFAGVIDLIFDDYVRKVRARLPSLPDFAAKLHHVASGWAGEGYDLTRAFPDAKDVFDVALPPVRAMYARLADFFAGILDEAGTARKAPASSHALAEVLIFGMRGLKDIACDAADMRRLIALQVDLVLAVVGERSAAPATSASGMRSRRSPRASRGGS